MILWSSFSELGTRHCVIRKGWSLVRRSNYQTFRVPLSHIPLPLTLELESGQANTGEGSAASVFTPLEGQPLYVFSKHNTVQ